MTYPIECSDKLGAESVKDGEQLAAWLTAWLEDTNSKCCFIEKVEEFNLRDYVLTGVSADQIDPPFVSSAIAYEKQDFIYDEDRPQFRYFVPIESGKCWMTDCWIIDESGNVHPGYSVAGVPVNTSGFVAAFDYRHDSL